MKKFRFSAKKKNVKQLLELDECVDFDACTLNSSSTNLLHKSPDCLMTYAVSCDVISCRIVVVGSSGVGKTAIISRFLTGDYVDGYTPTGKQFHRKEISSSGQHFVLDIVDTSGSSELPVTSILTGDAFLLVFSLTNEDTFGQIRTYFDQIVRIRGPDVPIVVIGNKNDVIERRLDCQATAWLVNVDWNHSYLETSAATDFNVTTAFQEILIRARASDHLLPKPTRLLTSTKASSRIRTKWLMKKRPSCIVS